MNATIRSNRAALLKQPVFGLSGVCRTRVSWRFLWSVVAVGALSLSGCGGDSGGSGPSTYTVGGTLAALPTGGSITLQDNSGDNLTLTANGVFTFVTPLANGAAYSVTVLTQPTGGICSASNNTGTIASASVTSVTVSCDYTVAGTVTGLPTGASVVLQDNGADNLTVSANGNFVFATPLASAAKYVVSVLTQPSGAACTVADNSGTIASAGISNVAVTCAVDTFTVGGTLSGLPAGTSVVLQDNGGNNLTVSTNGTFVFTTPLASGAAYAVTVLTQPTGAVCTVAGGSGTIASAVTTVAVTCAPEVTVGGTVSGLPTGASVVLQDNGGDNLTVTANGNFTFATALAGGAKYSVTILTQPTAEVCAVSNGSGTTATANITSVAVSCASGATTGSTAFSALSVGNSRIAMVPLNLFASSSTTNGVAPIAIDGTTKLAGSSVLTSFPIQSCSTDSINLVAICINYTSTTVAILNLSKFATSFNVADIVDNEYDTGVPQSTTEFSGGDFVIAGAVAVASLHSFVVAAFDGYHVYAYPASTVAAGSTLTASKVYAVPISENFTLSAANNWLISPDYDPSGTNTRALRVIDLVKQQAYTWATFTDNCGTSTAVACTNFAAEDVDSAAFADDTQILVLDDEQGDSQLTVDMSQAVFNAATSTFTAPSAYSDYSAPNAAAGVEMAGILASTVGHWGFSIAEFGSAVIGEQVLPAAGGSGGTLTLPTPAPIYLNLSSLTNFAPCANAPVGGEDPHAQGYTLSSAGVPLGLLVSGDSSCVAVINFGVLASAPTQASPNNYDVDLTSYDPVKAGAITLFAVPAAEAAAAAVKKTPRAERRSARSTPR